ncbi:ATP-dependent zinc protease [Microbacterium sp. NPDC089698]|uniref:ATP-dependent zinc protease family protein n=1 Tax=unclassified Microbacterium TaxID=2609290 RepID=UPI0028174867|nr:RimK/LysX family protein [Microbacterium sp.]MDR2323227.1 RimK/LysX family protein [Microbacterium sp.]
MSVVDRPSHSSTLIGWREWVSLPDVGIPWIKAKVDTGARSSSLHAQHIREFEREGVPWVRFDVRPWQGAHELVPVELPVFDRRDVRSSSGHAQSRLVVLLDLVLVDRRVTAEVTLSNRSEMGFRMLIGREALRQGFTIDPARSFLGGKAPKTFRRLNRGHTAA